MKGLLFAAVLTAALSGVAAVEPFSVDLYAKSADYKAYLFRGTRSVSYAYGEAGWSIGIMHNSCAVFNVSDGKNRSYVRWNALNSPWRPGEWNHMAAAFDGKTISFWINGRKFDGRQVDVAGGSVTNVCLVTSVASPRALIENGRDPMTGTTFKGGLKDFRLMPRLLSDAEIAERAAAVARLCAADPDMPRMVSDAEGIDVCCPSPVADVPLTLQPAPRTFTASADDCRLAAPFAIIAGDRGFDATAAETLRRVLAREFAVTNVEVVCGPVTTAPSPSGAGKGVKIVFCTDDRKERESYSIEGRQGDDGARVVRISAHDHAFVYAVDTLRQLLRIRSLAHDDGLFLPASFRIEDAPEMPERECIYNFYETPESVGERFALNRWNVVQYMLERAPEEKIRAWREVFDRYGLAMGGRVQCSGRNDPYTFSRPESMERLRQYVERLGRAGVHGISIAFDDLAGPSAAAYTDDPEMRRRYPTMSAYHNALVHRVLDYAAPYACLTNVPPNAVPVNYWRNYGKPGIDSFADFTRGFRARNIHMAHCVFGEEDVARLHADGAETFAHYLNGLWPTRDFFSWFTGQETLRWSWYTWYADLNGRGPVSLAAAMTDYRSLHLRTKRFHMASNTHIARQHGGIFSWRPSAYDPALAERATAQRFFGSGTYAPLRDFENAMMPVVGYTQAFRTTHSQEWDSQAVPRRVGTSAKELAGYVRNLKLAEAACARFEAALAAQKRLLDRPVDGRPSGVAAQMRKTIAAAREKLGSM